METPANDPTPTPAQRALDVLSENTEDTAALDALANSDVLIPVPDDANDSDAANPSAVALPVLEQPGGEPVVPVFTSEVARTSAALSSVADAPRRRPPPPCSCTHQAPLTGADQHRRFPAA
ncbi:SseB family protein [Streptomyces iakyrus]|uniref:SseB family protein n=1 Tax=Streptomyces iakyrus TaxID=68219 RepID=UPI000AD56209|nr:SseB family protein [Streptomyces iakyrus]